MYMIRRRLSRTKICKILPCKGPKVYSKHDQLPHSTSALAGLAVCTTTPAQSQAAGVPTVGASFAIQMFPRKENAAISS